MTLLDGAAVCPGCAFYERRGRKLASRDTILSNDRRLALHRMPLIDFNGRCFSTVTFSASKRFV